MEEEYKKLEQQINSLDLDDIGKVLFLDKYIQENINYDNNITDVEKAREIGDKELEQVLIEKHKESYRPIGFFKNKIAVCGSISQVAQKILNDLGINTKCLSGHIMMGNFAFGHMWNTIEIDGKEYNYDFTHEMINKHYYDSGYEMAMATMPKPESEVDYAFTNEFTPKRYIGGFVKDENGRIMTDERYKNGDFSTFSDDYSKYFKMDRELVQKKFQEVSKIYNEVYNIEDDKTL